MFNFIPRKMRQFILVLVIVLTGITFAFQYYLNIRLKHYEALSETSAAPSETEEQLIVAEAPFSENTEPDSGSLYEKFKKETESLEAETGKLTEGLNGTALRDADQKIADLWDAEMKSIADSIIQMLPRKERDGFIENQNNFLTERSHETMKEIGSGKTAVAEKTDYLARYAELTSQRCAELLKDYGSYLDNS